MLTESGELLNDTFIATVVVVLDILETVKVDDRLEAGESGVDSRLKYADEILGGVSREFDNGSARSDGRVIGGSSDALDQRWCQVAQSSGKKTCR